MKTMIVTKSTKFPRSWTDRDQLDGESVSFIMQPYITGIYLSASMSSRTVTQMSVNYNSLEKLLSAIKKTKATDVVLQDLGDYLSEEEIEMINSSLKPKK